MSIKSKLIAVLALVTVFMFYLAGDNFYNAYKNDKSIAVPKKQKATRSNIIDIYTTLIKLDASSFFDKLYNSSEYYNRLINLGNESNSREVRSSLIDLYNISAAPSYVLLLYVFEKLQLSDNQKVELIDYMVKFFVVRHITNTPPTRDLDNIFIEVISMLHNNNGYDFELISNFLKEKTSGFDNFKNKLSGSIYDENSGATRFILCKIEDANGQITILAGIAGTIWAASAVHSYLNGPGSEKKKREKKEKKAEPEPAVEEQALSRADINLAYDPTLQQAQLKFSVPLN